MADTNKKIKEPFLRIAEKGVVPRWYGWAVRGSALAISLLVCSIFIFFVAGASPIRAFKEMWAGTFGIPGNSLSMKIRCWDSAIYAAKLLCIAVALAPAFKMKFWNIGAEGQVIIGAMSSAFVLYYFSEDMPLPVLFIVMFTVCILAGAIWGIIPAVCKAFFDTNETLFTLMMNYVAMRIMDYFYNDWKGLNAGLPKLNESTKIGYLPEILGKGYFINIVVFILIAVGMYFYLSKTKHGYEISVVGESVNTARYAGINVKKVIIRTMAISGAICGLCGGLTIAGETHCITLTSALVNPITNGYGFTAIIVAWLAKFNTLVMIAISMLIVFLEKGMGQLGNVYPEFSTGSGNVLIGIVLFFIIGSEFFIRYRLIFRNKKKEASENA